MGLIKGTFITVSLVSLMFIVKSDNSSLSTLPLPLPLQAPSIIESKNQFVVRKCCEPNYLYNINMADNITEEEDRCVKYSISSSHPLKSPQFQLLLGSKESFPSNGYDVQIDTGFPRNCTPDSNGFLLDALYPQESMRDLFRALSSGQLLVPNRFVFFEFDSYCIDDYAEERNFSKASRRALICINQTREFPETAIDDSGKLRLDFIKFDTDGDREFASKFVGRKVIRKCCPHGESMDTLFDNHGWAACRRNENLATLFFDQLQSEDMSRDLFFRFVDLPSTSIYAFYCPDEEPQNFIIESEFSTDGLELTEPPITTESSFTTDPPLTAEPESTSTNDPLASSSAIRIPKCCPPGHETGAEYNTQVFHCITLEPFKRYRPVFLLISIVALSMTFVIYFFVPASGASKLILQSKGKKKAGYSSTSYINYWAFIAPFSWLTVSTTTASLVSNDKLFIPYSAFGWGVPSLAMISVIITQFQSTAMGISDTVNPNMGLVRCSFPLGALLSMDIYFFLSLMFNSNLMHCWQKQQGTAIRSNRRPSTASKEHEDLKMATKLFFITGVPWIFEFFTTYVYELKYGLYTKLWYFWEFCQLLNTLRGVFIFVNFIILNRDVRRFLWLGMKNIFSRKLFSPSEDEDNTATYHADDEGTCSTSASVTTEQTTSTSINKSSNEFSIL
uniref:G-protein coupled receptors family 2 profile 2 domain-containing protein n=1 Tax=Daphnia galeata TaxID=27404 RepID=A0A8J2RIA2_9CRUS|nr:unnamed protein product [Daphnia galeata]